MKSVEMELFAVTYSNHQIVCESHFQTHPNHRDASRITTSSPGHSVLNCPWLPMTVSCRPWCSFRNWLS
eukprot:s3182_g3.t1